MSVMTKGFGTSDSGGSIITKGLQTVVFIKPTFTPDLVRARVVGDPGVVSAHTPTSVYRIIAMLFRRLVYGY